MKTQTADIEKIQEQLIKFSLLKYNGEMNYNINDVIEFVKYYQEKSTLTKHTMEKTAEEIYFNLCDKYIEKNKGLKL